MQITALIFKDRSLWYKLTLLSVLPAVIVTIAVAYKVMGSMENAMTVEARKKAETLTDLMQLSMSHPFVVYNKNLLDNFVDALGRIQSIEYAMIVDSSDNRILAHNNHQLDGKLIHQVSDALNLSSPKEVLSFNGRNGAGDYYSVSAPIMVSDKQYAAMHIGFSDKEVNRQMASAKNQIMLVAILAGVLVLHFIGFLQSLVFWVLVLLILVLFRDPERDVPSQPLAVVSPADGLAIGGLRTPSTPTRASSFWKRQL